jgi:hypothetical protein
MNPTHRSGFLLLHTPAKLIKGGENQSMDEAKVYALKTGMEGV